jgi:hypothetical protein
MKTLLLLLCLLPLTLVAQTVRTTTGDGDFLNPFIWNPIGVPASGDTLYINHDVVMSTDIYYTAGQINVSSGASLVEDATDRAFWADGTGSIINNGTFTAHLFLISPAASAFNAGNFVGLDSVWVQGTVLNTGSMQSYDVLNDETANFSNQGQFEIQHDMNNQGYFENAQWAEIDLVNNFSNCNLQTLDAMFENDGIFCIGNDFSTCVDDTITGIGHIYIGGNSANLGVIEGDQTIHTSTGSLGIAGTLGMNVTVTTGGCALSVYEEELNTTHIYPNPASEEIVLGNYSGHYQIVDVCGKQRLSGDAIGVIDISSLRTGVYLVVMGDVVERLIVK